MTDQLPLCAILAMGIKAIESVAHHIKLSQLEDDDLNELHAGMDSVSTVAAKLLDAIAADRRRRIALAKNQPAE